MPKVTFNKLIHSLHGRVGDLILYESDGQTLSRTMPAVTAERSDKQKANADRFLAAQKYAAQALQDPVLKSAYKAACRGHQNPRNLAIRDAMRAPLIESINLDGYAGKLGQNICVKAVDDFRVIEVKVTVRDPVGGIIEEGTAPLSSDGSEWRYVTTKEVPPGQSVSVLAVARDNPGNTTVCRHWHYIPLSTG